MQVGRKAWLGSLTLLLLSLAGRVGGTRPIVPPMDVHDL